MPQFEYKVLPAPTKGKRNRGSKGSAGRLAFAVQEMINDLALSGWEYQRSDTLPIQERSGLTGRVTVYHNMLVFRRPLVEAPHEQPLAAPSTSEPDDNVFETETSDSETP
jgi:hypothetical protein